MAAPSVETKTPSALDNKSSVHLPTRAERPQADVVIFDGHCRFCRAQVERINRCDSRGALAYVSLHDPSVARDFPDLTHDELMKQMYVVTQSGQRYGGVESLRYLSRKLPWMWPAMPLLHLPLSGPIWRFLYRQVAKRRYWFGKTVACTDDTCDIHFR